MSDAEKVYRARPTDEEIAGLLSQRAAAHEANRRLRAKYIKSSVLPELDRAWGQIDDVAVEITPQRTRSWTGAALHEETQRQISVPYGDMWLPDE